MMLTVLIAAGDVRGGGPADLPAVGELTLDPCLGTTGDELARW